MLREEDRVKLDGIVQQMTANNEPDENIRLVVNDFKQKYSQSAPSELEQNKDTSILGNFSEGFVKGGLSTLRGLGKIGSKIGEQTIGRVEEALTGRPKEGITSDIYKDETPLGQKVTEMLKPEGAAQNIGFATERIAEFLAPSSLVTKVKTAATGAIKGTGTLSKVAKLGTKSGIEGATIGAQSTLQQGEINDDVKTAAIIGALFPVLGSAIKSSGSLAQKAGKKIQQSGIKPSVRDVSDGFKIENIQKYNLGGSLGQTLAKTNSKMNEISSLIKSKLKDSVVPVNLKSVYENTEKRLLENKIGNFGDIASIQKILGNLKGEISEVGGQNGLVDLVEANLIKRGAGTKGSWVFGMVDPDSRAVEKVYNTFYNEIKVAIEQAAEKSGQAGIRELNKQLSELIPINNAVLRRIPVAERNNALSLTDIITLTGSILDPQALVLTGVNKLSTSGKVGNILTNAGSAVKDPKVRNNVLKRFLD